jgi:hypothetical protein
MCKQFFLSFSPIEYSGDFFAPHAIDAFVGIEDLLGIQLNHFHGRGFRKLCYNIERPPMNKP